MKRYSYQYPRAALTVDCVVFGFDQGDLKVLLIQRSMEPYKGGWALPGGFVHVDETLDEAARRELAEETGLRDVFLEQLYTFGAIDRDPRERVVSVAYYALVKRCAHIARASTDAACAEWFPVSDTPALAFDHGNILAMALARLKGKVCYQPVGFELLPSQFTLSELQHLYEVILDKKLDKRNFRKKVLSFDLLIKLAEIQRQGRHRPAQLYQFDFPRYEELSKHGFHLEL